MLDFVSIYDALYLLASGGGREEPLFGGSKELAHEAFALSVAGDEFPIVWFELPLVGRPRFDLHVALSREALTANPAFAAGAGNGYDELFAWYGQEEAGGRGLAFAYDVGDGRIADPAVHVNVNNAPLGDMARFFELASGEQAARTYRDFERKLPSSWSVWYAGVHPGRPGSPVRVDCFVDRACMAEYARDIQLFEHDLRACGFTAMSPAVLELAGLILASPFGLELQFDVLEDGSVGPTIGLSASFSTQFSAKARQDFEDGGTAAALLARTEQLGLADERWRLLAGTIFATSVNTGDATLGMYCVPTFVKLRVRDGEPLDAKAYLQASALIS